MAKHLTDYCPLCTSTMQKLFSHKSIPNFNFSWMNKKRYSSLIFSSCIYKMFRINALPNRHSTLYYTCYNQRNLNSISFIKAWIRRCVTKRGKCNRTKRPRGNLVSCDYIKIMVWPNKLTTFHFMPFRPYHFTRNKTH